MIYAELNDSFIHMSPQQRTRAQKIKNDPPASDFGMMVAARMVLPSVSDSIDPSGLRQSSDENFRAEHPSFQNRIKDLGSVL
jgi:hypothetical protein